MSKPILFGPASVYETILGNIFKEQTCDVKTIQKKILQYLPRFDLPHQEVGYLMSPDAPSEQMLQIGDQDGIKEIKLPWGKRNIAFGDIKTSIDEDEDVITIPIDTLLCHENGKSGNTMFLQGDFIVCIYRQYWFEYRYFEVTDELLSRFGQPIMLGGKGNSLGFYMKAAFGRGKTASSYRGSFE